MNVSEVAAGLYPVALALANIGVGAGLYEVGAPLLALALWLSGVLVLAGAVSSNNSGVTRTGESSI